MSLLGSAKHQSLVNGAESLNFVLGLLEPRLKLLGGHLEILDVGGSAVEEGNLAWLLVGDGECVLETTVTVTKLITTPLLRLDALTTNGLTADIGSASSRDRGLELIIVLVGIIIAGLSSRGLCRRTSSGCRDGIEAMRSGNRCVGNAVDGRRRVSPTPAAAPARSKAIGRELASAKVVDGRGGDAVIGRGVWTTGGGGSVVGGGGVRVLAEGVSQVEGVEVKTGRWRRGTWQGHGRDTVGRLRVLEIRLKVWEGVVSEGGVHEGGATGVLEEGRLHCVVKMQRWNDKKNWNTRGREINKEWALSSQRTIEHESKEKKKKKKRKEKRRRVRRRRRRSGEF
jgi:hypothetical protein